MGEVPMTEVRVACGQGFYGDTPTAVDALLAEGVDYLCLEALAELTLAILQKDRQRDESRGYTRDLPAYISRALPFVADGRTSVSAPWFLALVSIALVVLWSMLW